MAAAEHQHAYTYIQAGDKASARQVLRQALDRDPNDLKGWLLMARAADTRQQRADALYHVLDIDPTHPQAAEALQRMGLDPRKAKRGDALPGAKRKRGSTDSRRTLLIIGGIIGLLILVGGAVALIATSTLSAGVTLSTGPSKTIVDQGILVVDQPASLTITDTETHRFSFNGAEGQGVRLLALELDEFTSPDLRITDAEGTQIAEVHNDLAYDTNYLTTRLPAAGLYYVEVESFFGGPYELTIEDANVGLIEARRGNRSPADLLYVNQGSIEHGSGVQNVFLNHDDLAHGYTYTFRGRGEITVEAIAMDDWVDPELLVFAPDGTQVGYHDDIDFMDNENAMLVFEVSQPGDYLFVVNMEGIFEGPYQLNVY